MVFTRIKKFLGDFFYILILQIALGIATGIDYIVHNVLYSYGLQFSYSWAVPYWTLFSLLFVIFALIGTSGYLVDREHVNKKEIILVFSTILAEYFGGFEDTIFFSIQKILSHDSFDWFGHWWWHSYNKLFGFWNLQRNIILNILVGSILIIAWIIELRKDRNP